MFDKVITTIKENNMFVPNDKVIVAVSGGPDSICLLHILNRIKVKYNLTLYAAHVNHCLRGEEADKDEEYVKAFCKKIGIACFSKRVDVNKLAREKGLSSESAGREARYDFFNELFDKLGADKIALAHNANDQAETVLMRIVRGSGMEGLIGIRPIRGNIFVRPLINIRRESIESYCKENFLEPRIDKTNLENIYARNKVRLELIPYIMDNFNSDVISAINRLADTISKDNEYLEEIALEKYKGYCDEKALKVIINSEAFLEKEAIITRVLRLALNRVKGNLYNVEKKHIYDIINLQKSGTGKKLNLPSGIICFNNYDNIELYFGKIKNNPDIVNNNYLIKINETVDLPAFGIEVSTRLIDNDEKINFKENSYLKYFDYDKIKGNIIIRARKDGDKFTPFGMKGSKKLKDFFIDLKIPQEERDKIPLICFGDTIAWIVGCRISERFKIHKETKNILEIKINKRGNNQ
ncbi:tRNA lysidine(34) synthetase TilS [Candidatus Clostridium stratigraminis]|uniref:tRNA(Ile)-lysidine synthase n=1 Tax=Candidatus Clostridium stratigraminis TaxID=3381661 RepID=A0ABW8T774_9CLOT